MTIPGIGLSVRLFTTTNFIAASVAVAWIFELTWPLVWLSLWFRLHPDRPGRLRRLFNRLRVREIYVAIGITMHLSIEMVLNVGPFGWATLAYYPCLFRPGELRTLAQRIAARRKR